MKKSNWFDDVFIPSLFDYFQKGGKTISEKQLYVFEGKNGVKSHQLLQQNSINGGFYVFGSSMEYKWRGREVYVYPQSNGRARISFSMTKEEKENWKIEQEKDGESEKIREIKEMKKENPERFSQRLEKAEKRLIKSIRYLDASAASDDDDDFSVSVDDFWRASKIYYMYYFA